MAQHRYTWAVSTGVRGTPSGSFRPQSLARYHRSSLYNSAPMPYSIFYDGNFAIHGTTHVRQLGGRASKGCVRLHPSNAAVLFSLVQSAGLSNTRNLDSVVSHSRQRLWRTPYPTPHACAAEAVPAYRFGDHCDRRGLRGRCSQVESSPIRDRNRSALEPLFQIAHSNRENVMAIATKEKHSTSARP